MKRLALALAGAATATSLVAAATLVWLWLTQPAMVAKSIAEGNGWPIVAAAAWAVASAVGRVIQRL